MWPQAIIHTYAQYTFVHAQYSLVVWGLLRLTPIKGNSQWQTERLSSRHASSLILLCDNSNYGMSNRPYSIY